MRARFIVMCGALMLGCLVASGCDEDAPRNEPDASTQEDAGTSGPDAGDGGGTGADGGGTAPDAGVDGGMDAGSRVSDFNCDVSQQQGCDAGASCHYTDLTDGGTGSRCFAAPCDVVRQDCPSGQRCTYVLANTVRTRACVEDGTSAEGDPCSLAGTSSTQSYDTCAKGLYCLDTALTDGGTAFQCQRFCHDSAQCTAPRECNEVLRLSGTQELPFVCGAPSARCDLLAQDCAGPLACYPSRSRGTAVCSGAGGLGEGAPCEFSDQCARGSACVGPEATRVCRTLCRHPSGEPSCPTGRTCQPLAAYPGVGACVP
jgi:hypothetical protein